MRKALTIACLSASALIILDTLNAGHALVMFLFAGVLPGTNVAISADRMLEIFALLLGFTLSRVTIALGRLVQETPKTHPSNGTMLSAQS